MADDRHYPVEVIGRVKFGREIMIRDVQIIRGPPGLDATPCLSVEVGNHKARLDLKRMNGRRIRASGDTIDFFAEVRADPIAATISPMQNTCGNMYILLIERVARASR
ncbi:MAG: hypothetical protein ACJ8EB_04710 [Allosphingosinicella sp.]